MNIIPVKAVPNQTLDVQLGTQPCSVNIYQQAYGLYMDVLVNGVDIVDGVICLNRNKIVRSVYLGFDGDFAWFDTQGLTDPVYTGLGDRYLLVYLTAAEALDQ